ncbi:cupin domain-containing protein [Pantoea sp. A4]|uniref:cupin domain-containing protein n=1 Tax=Pantoea sp. A4 TaxID=1225184 RepID=UPI00036F3753|nr:cupin domain-containing protein [Pantoea sp. A4]
MLTRRHFLQISTLTTLTLPAWRSWGANAAGPSPFELAEQWYAQPADWVPNHPGLPVVHFRRALPDDPLKAKLQRSGWRMQWQGQPFAKPYFHSQAHVLHVVTAGTGVMQTGGEKGKQVQLRQGDLLFLPAGTGQQLLSADPRFQTQAWYPEKQSWDVCRSALSASAQCRQSATKLSAASRKMMQAFGTQFLTT